MDSSLHVDEEIAEIYNRHYNTVYRICFSFMKNAEDAEDMVQETFLKLISSKKQFESEEHEKAWLIRTTIQICLDILKSGWYQRTVPWSEAFERAAKNIYLPYQVRDDRTLEAVLQLPVHYRNPIYLFYYEDYTIHEIAGILNVKEATIKTRLRRGREEVKKILTEGRP